MFHYSGSELGAIRHKHFKIHLKESKGGLPNMEFYNAPGPQSLRRQLGHLIHGLVDEVVYMHILCICTKIKHVKLRRIQTYAL